MWMLTEKWAKQCNVFSICYIHFLGGGGKLPNTNYQKCKLPKLQTTNSFPGGVVNYQMQTTKNANYQLISRGGGKLPNIFQ